MVTFVLDGTPLPLNKLLRAHWSVSVREKHRWWTLIFGQCGHGPWKYGKKNKKKAYMQVVVRPIRRQDQDNLSGSLKPMIDAFRQAGWLVDDTEEWLKFVVEQRPRGDDNNPRTEIRIGYGKP